MKKLSSIVCFLLAIPAFAQISADSSQKEQQKIMSLSAYQTIDYFSTARELKIPARKGDAIVLQDEERRLYFGIIDSVKSMNSIQIVLYPKANKRELVQATYDDLYYLKNRPAAKNEITSQPVQNVLPPSGSWGIMDKAVNEAVEKAVQKALSRNQNPSGDLDSELEARLEKLERQNESMQLRINQAAFSVEGAGQAYETADILRYVSYASLFLGSVFLSAGSFGNSNSLEGAGVILTLTSAATSIGSLVYRFKGHSKLKTAGTYLRN
jgi:hypothetical protein